MIEVADSSLESDRIDKSRIYSRNNLPTYWIVNIPDQQIEVYTQPSGPTLTPAYAHRQDYRMSDAIPLLLDGVMVASLAVSDLLP